MPLSSSSSLLSFIYLLFSLLYISLPSGLLVYYIKWREYSENQAKYEEERAKMFQSRGDSCSLWSWYAWKGEKSEITRRRRGKENKDRGGEKRVTNHWVAVGCLCAHLWMANQGGIWGIYSHNHTLLTPSTLIHRSLSLHQYSSLLLLGRTLELGMLNFYCAH